MIKRLTWFMTGLVAGAGTVVLIGRRIKRKVADLAPVRVAERALGRTRESVVRVKEAIGEGRSAASQRENELRHRLLDDPSEKESRFQTRPHNQRSSRTHR